MVDDKRLERIEDKVDIIGQHVGSINVTLAGQHISLEEHIRRTALLESELKPIKKHVDMVSGAMKLLAVAATLIAIYKALK